MKYSIREQHDKCRHFTGLCCRADGSVIDLLDKKEKAECRAHVKYDDVRKQGKRMVALPCFHLETDNMPADGIWPTCDKLSFKTAEELDKEEAETERIVKESIERIAIVRPMILKHAGCEKGKPKVSKVGEFSCLVCKTGKLHYSVSSYNGHVHAACDTKDCVQWME